MRSVLLEIARLIWTWTEEHETLRRWVVTIFRRPKLYLSFAGPRCSENVTFEAPLSQTGVAEGRVFRVRLENFGHSTAASCRVYVDSVVGPASWDAAHGTETLVERELSNALSWVERDDFEARDLPPKIPTYVNVFYIREDRIGARLCTMKADAGGHALMWSGEYDIVVRAEGENFVSPGEITLRLHHGGAGNLLGSWVEAVSERAQIRLA